MSLIPAHSLWSPSRGRTKLWLLCFVAISPSLGTAIAAIGRLLLYLLALVCLVRSARARTTPSPLDHAKDVSVTILLTCAYMAMTVTWSSVEIDSALIAWTRHARLLTIPILCYLIANSAEELAVLRAFAYGQIFVLLSAWLLVFGIHMPWAIGIDADTSYAVFGTYLEQSISQSVLVAILWFKRGTLLGKNGRWLAIVLAVLALVLTLGFLKGRSGHLVALGVITLACLQATPKKFRWVAAVSPLVVFALITVSSQNLRIRMTQVVDEVTLYSHTKATNTSSGERLVYWEKSLQAIAEKPLLGHGAGSWNFEYRRLLGDDVAPLTSDNPHQLFLLWAVEGGLVGMVLLMAVLWSLLAYSKKLEDSDARTLQALVWSLIISGMFNSMIFGIGMGDFFCIGLGILLRATKPATNSESLN